MPLAAQLEQPVVLRLDGMDKVDVRKNVAYDGDRKLDFYRPANAATVPLVIFLNGVGRPDLKEWGQYTSWPRLVAARGMAAISYETSGSDVAPQTDALLRYVRDHAAEWKIDAKRIAIWSCSANVRLGTAMLASRDELITYPEGLHGFELDNDTPESRQIVMQTLDFLQFHLTTEPTPRKEPMTLAQLQRLFAENREAALARLKEIRRTHPNAYVLQERTLNSLGYALMSDQKFAEAVAILELVAATYPDSANAHDSLGDAYEAAGRPADAIRESERALALVEKVPGPQSEAIRRSAEEKLARLK
jgi:hypothetical protein